MWEALFGRAVRDGSHGGGLPFVETLTGIKMKRHRHIFLVNEVGDNIICRVTFSHFILGVKTCEGRSFVVDRRVDDLNGPGLRSKFLRGEIGIRSS